MVFLDASALAKAYLDEEGTRSVLDLLERRRESLFLSEFVALEVFTSIRNALRNVGATAYDEVVERFRIDYQTRFTVLPVSGEVSANAISLTTRRRSARARSMDVLHVATALRLKENSRAADQEVTVVTSDRDLAALAEECGRRTFDPSREPLAALPRTRRG
jgi:predicted nucleic acid-binding protein